MKDWRNQDEGALHQYKLWLGKWATSRIQKGRNEYGAGQKGAKFQGDPLKHASEEAFDLPFYIRYAELQRNALQAVLSEVQDYLENMENYENCPEKLFQAPHSDHRTEIMYNIMEILELIPRSVDEDESTQ